MDHMKEVFDGIRELFNEYSIGSTTLDEESARSGGSLASTMVVEMNLRASTSSYMKPHKIRARHRIWTSI